MKREIVNRILAETPRIYDKIAADFSHSRPSSWEGFSDFVHYAKDGDNILDLGCGNGRMVQLFEKLKIYYLGLDNSRELIGIAREKYKDKPNYKFEVADALDLRLKADSFDLVLMIAALHHIPTREHRLKILKDLYAALKPGGRIVVSNWNLWKIGGRKMFRYYPYLLDFSGKARRGVYGLTDAFVPWKANLRQSEWQPRYVHSFGKREMKSLLKEAGFALDYVSYAKKNKGQATILSGDNLLAVAIKK